MDELKHGQFVVVAINAKSEEKTCISTVNYLVVSELKK